MVDYTGMMDMMGFGWPYTMTSGMTALLLVALLVVFWALIDIMKRKDLDVGKRVSWVLIVLMAGFFPLAILGAIAYFIFGKKKGG